MIKEMINNKMVMDKEISRIKEMILKNKMMDKMAKINRMDKMAKINKMTKMDRKMILVKRVETNHKIKNKEIRKRRSNNNKYIFKINKFYIVVRLIRIIK